MYAQILDFVSRHTDIVILAIMAIAGVLGGAKYLQWVQSSQIFDLAVESAFSAVDRIRHESPGTISDPTEKGIELLHDLYRQLRKAPPANYEILAKTQWTAWHDAATVAGAAPVTPK